MAEENEPGSKTDSNPPDFPLFDEGSLFGLERSPARRWFDRFTLWQQIMIVVSVTWIPLAVLAAIQGVAVDLELDLAHLSFFEDAAIYARFFVALPILLATPSKCRYRFQQLIQHFLNSGLVKDTDRERFVVILTSTMRLRYSHVADWVCLAIAYGRSAALVFHPAVALANSAAWRTIGPAGLRSLSLAMWYFVVVSQPVFGFVALHFLYRVCLWWRTLWMISRLDLQLKGSHPDGGGGLMFLALSLARFKWPAFALATSLAGGTANLVLATGVSVLSFKYVIILNAAIISALFAGPLCLFYGQLKRTKVRDLLSYDRVAQEQLRQFEQNWIERSRQTDMLQVQDFSAVIDLNSTVDKVHQMRPLPFRRNQLLELLAAALLPFLPVLAMQIPIKDLFMMLKELI